jgi:hypothetical protein
MIEKIISGGRPGAERAALDAAIKLGMAYGGWIPKEGSRLGGMKADRYNLTPMPTTDRTESFKKNIRESDGTLMLSHGTLSSDVKNTKNTIQRYSTPLLHVDLNSTNAFNAASLINDWLIDNDLNILHVTGPTENEDGKIYSATLDILQAVYFLNLTETSMNQSMGAQELLAQPLKTAVPPKTVQAAVDIIINEMHLKDRTLMANLRKEELAPLQLNLGLYIRKKLDIWSQDATLYHACVAAAEKENLDKSNMPMVLIMLMWKKLKDTHRLRVVK